MHRNIHSFKRPGAFVVITLLVAANAAALELADVVDLVRTRHCDDQSIPDRPLRASAELDAAAKSMAEGSDLATAIAAAHYRARTSASVKLSTSKGRNDLIAKVLSERFCHVVTNPDFIDLGVYRKGQVAWLVFADGAPLPGPDDTELVDRLLARVNELRFRSRDCGSRHFAATKALRHSAALQRAAQRHAQDMAASGFLDHTGSDGSRPSDRATREGYAWQRIAENVAAGQTRIEDVSATWLESPGHCENLMDPRYTETGIAYVVNERDERGIFWVQVYAVPD